MFLALFYIIGVFIVAVETERQGHLLNRECFLKRLEGKKPCGYCVTCKADYHSSIGQHLLRKQLAP